MPVLAALDTPTRIAFAIERVHVSLLLVRAVFLALASPTAEHEVRVPDRGYTKRLAGRIRLVAQDTALSRRRHGFESRMRL